MRERLGWVGLDWCEVFGYNLDWKGRFGGWGEG